MPWRSDDARIDAAEERRRDDERPVDSYDGDRREDREVGPGKDWYS